jgi:hypothetical protein
LTIRIQCGTKAHHPAIRIDARSRLTPRGRPDRSTLSLLICCFLAVIPLFPTIPDAKKHCCLNSLRLTPTVNSPKQP